MKTYELKISELLLPEYITDCLKEVDWIKSSNDTIVFHPDDMILIFYGTRGSTSFSGSDHIRYGSNTTSYQFFSPKLPTNILYLGDGGSGILEIDKTVIKKCFASGVNMFDEADLQATREKMEPILKKIINTYSHYHPDHLLIGVPLTGTFHANALQKVIIGARDPKSQFKIAFSRPMFPRDFKEIEAAYKFTSIKDVRSSVLIFFPNGEYGIMGISHFNELLAKSGNQITIKGINFNIEDCVIIKLFDCYHPDGSMSLRYENYNTDRKLTTSSVFMTDHEISERDYMNNYFANHIKNCDFLYIDGQYHEKSYIAGFGHGMVEIIAEMSKKLELNLVGIGHHAPSETDEQIDAKIDTARSFCEGTDTEIIGIADRTMIFIPCPTRGRKGIVEGQSNSDLDQFYSYKDLTKGE